ncbi:substrate-binding periplasmic protein [Zobellella sp. DQSA1]|uniref:substrate-binding periplasmic protein n=1 Tax=Zobellella sp. DQSA1 TaxID=3342386 RepID=UPI0035C19AAA
MINRKNNKAGTALAFALLTAAFSAAPNAASACTTLSASGNAEYPPYLWRDSTNPGHLTGAVSYLLEDLAELAGIEITLVDSGPWGRTQEEVAAGQVDMMAGAFFTQARSEWMDYLYPAFLHTRTAIWTHLDSRFEFREWHDLIPHAGVTVTYNSFGQEFDLFAREHLNIEQVGSLEQGLMMLSQQRADYLIYEDNPGKAYAELLGLDNIQPLPRAVTRQPLYLALSGASPCNTEALQARLSAALARIAEAQRMERHLDRAVLHWQQSRPH